MKKKVLVVDDSSLMRTYLRNTLQKAGFEVKTAHNGQDCLSTISAYQPDVITLDINMPVMDGLTCLKQIMERFPKPVVMVSSLTSRGAITTFEALELGAVDYVEKPQGSVLAKLSQTSPLLIEKVKNACLAPPPKRTQSSLLSRQTKRTETQKKPLPYSLAKKSIDLVVVGVSTGGPNCLQEILVTLPEKFPVPIVIAQHMPARFTEVFSQRLNKITKLKVVEVTKDTELQPGHVYIAKGDTDIEIEKQGGKLSAIVKDVDASYLWHPSVSKLVSSAMKVVPPKNLFCIQLTGMGNDGAKEMKEAHGQGATTIAESEETAVVYGMPRELVKAGGASFELPNYKIAETLVNNI